MMLHSPMCVQGEDADLGEEIFSQELEPRDGKPSQAPRAVLLSISPPVQHCVRLSTKGQSPSALLRTCISTMEKGFLNLQANWISAFPLFWRWWTLPHNWKQIQLWFLNQNLKKPKHWSDNICKATQRERQERSRDRFQDIQQLLCFISFSLSNVFIKDCIQYHKSFLEDSIYPWKLFSKNPIHFLDVLICSCANAFHRAAYSYLCLWR